MVIKASCQLGGFEKLVGGPWYIDQADINQPIYLKYDSPEEAVIESIKEHFSQYLIAAKIQVYKYRKHLASVAGGTIIRPGAMPTALDGDHLKKQRLYQEQMNNYRKTRKKKSRF